METQDATVPEVTASLLHRVSSVKNPRSRTGVVRYDLSSNTVHYKQFDDHAAMFREAQALQRADTATKSCLHVRPLHVVGCCSENKLLLTDYAEGYQSLFNYLWNNSSLLRVTRFAQSTPERITGELSTWLRKYHESTTTATARNPSRLQTIVTKCIAKLDILADRFSGTLPVGTVAKLKSYFAGAQRQAESWDWGAECYIHGDLAPCNILIGPSGDLIVIDFADSRDGLAIEDVVRFWHELWSISQTSTRRRRMLTRALEVFIDAYGHLGLKERDPLFTLCRCFNALSVILSFKMYGRYFGVAGYFAAHCQSATNCRWLASLLP